MFSDALTWTKKKHPALMKDIQIRVDVKGEETVDHN